MHDLDSNVGRFPNGDRGGFWEAEPDWSSAQLRSKELSVDIAEEREVQIVNGALQRAFELVGIKSSPIGWADIATGPKYAIALASDKAMMLGTNGLTPGWHLEGFSISSAESADIIFDISGEGVNALLDRGADMSMNSRSCVRLFAGFPAVLYRFEHRSRIRIHIAKPNAAAFWKWLTLQFHFSASTHEQ